MTTNAQGNAQITTLSDAGDSANMHTHNVTVRCA